MKKPHRGWIVTLAGGLMMFYALGMVGNILSVFLNPLIVTLGLTKTQGSSIIMVLNLAGTFGMLLAGPLTSHFGARRSGLSGGLLISAGYFLFMTAHSLGVCYAAVILLGIGYGTGSMIPISVLISNWFQEKRGLALGIATAGSGLSTIIYPPILAYFLATSGLAFSFRFLAVNVLILALITFCLSRERPSDVGLLPYGATVCAETSSEQDHSQSTTELTGLLLVQAFRRPTYYAMMLATFAMGFNNQTLVGHISVIVSSNGYSQLFSATMVSVFGATMLFSKPLYGLLIDKMGILRSNVIMYGLWVLGLLSGLLIAHNPVMPWLFVIFIGMGAPLGTIAIPMWSTALFGLKDLANFHATLKTSFALGGTIGMILPGWLADRTGSYLTAMWPLLLAVLLSFFLVQWSLTRGKSLR